MLPAVPRNTINQACCGVCIVVFGSCYAAEGSKLGSRFCGENRVSVGTSRGQLTVFSGAYTSIITVLQHVYNTWLYNTAALRAFWSD